MIDSTATSTKQYMSASDSAILTYKERTDIAISLRVLVFLSFLTAAFFVNVDGSIFAPALLSIESDLDITGKQIAILSSVTFLVCGIFTIVTAPVFLRFEARQVLAFSAICNSIGTIMFIGSDNYYVMVMGRALSGVAQAWICTYSPVWINEYAPHAFATTWLGIYQACCIFGGVSGTVLGSMAADNRELGIQNWFTWRTTLFFPALAFLMLALTWYCLRNMVMDTQEEEKEAEKRQKLEDRNLSTRSLSEQIPVCNDLFVLLSNPIYLLTMMGLTTLMFAAGGLQFWTISYMQVVLFMDPIHSQQIFVVVMFSSMLPGVAIGSTLADNLGGYKGKGMTSALSLCCVFGSLATFFSLALSRCFDPDTFVYLLWCFFFFGAGCMPISAGIIVSSVPKNASNSGSALYGILQNILGLSLSPVLSGHIMEQYENKRQGMIVGYRILLYAGIVLTLFFISARCVAQRQQQQKVKQDHMHGKSQSHDLNISAVVEMHEEQYSSEAHVTGTMTDTQTRVI